MGENVETAADALTKAMDAYMSTDVSVSSQLHQQATWLEQS
jgi:alcohol dehydrogenase class IV